MSAQLSPVPKMQFWGTTGSFQGKPLAGGKLYTCIAGGTPVNLKPTYLDYSATAQNPNPVILDINGMANIWLTGFYKFFLYDANDVLQYSIDNINAASDGGEGAAIGIWMPAPLAPVYVSADTFKLAIYAVNSCPAGQRIRATLATGDIYGTVGSVSYDPSGDKTTIVCIWDAGQLDDTLSGVSISAIVQQPSPLPICPVSKRSSNYTLQLTDMNQMFVFDILKDSSMELPSPGRVPSGAWVRVKNVGPAQLTIAGQIGGMIDPKLGILDEVFLYTDNLTWLGVFPSVNCPIEIVSDSTTLPSWQVNRTYIVSASAITLPLANTVSSGSHLKIFSNNTSLSIYGTINGMANLLLGLHDFVELFSDGAAWYGGGSISGQLEAPRISSFDGLLLRIPTATDNLIEVSAGSCPDATAAAILYSPFTIGKVTNMAWTYGTNQGGLDFTYIAGGGNLILYVYIIDTDSKSAVDIIFSKSSTAPTLPAGYKYWRLLGAFKTGDNGLPVPGTFYGDYFYYSNLSVSDVDYSFDAATTSRYVAALPSVPNNAIGILQVKYKPVAFRQVSQRECAISLTSGVANMGYPAPFPTDYTFSVLATGIEGLEFQRYYPDSIVDERLIPVDDKSNISIFCANAAQGLQLRVTVKALGWIFRREAFLPSQGVSPTTYDTWYVRPIGLTYGKADGTSYADAWAGFDAIDWLKIAAGHTLYIAGDFKEPLTIAKGGAFGTPFIIRGDYPDAFGTISVTAGDAITAKGLQYVTLKCLTINKAANNGINLQNTSNCSVLDCNLYQIGTSGSLFFGIDGRYAQALSVEGCLLSNARGQFYASGIITAQGLKGTISRSNVNNSSITGIAGNGVVAGNDTIVADLVIQGITGANGIVAQGARVHIARNVIADCLRAVYVGSFDMGASRRSICEDVTVDSNLIYQTTAIPHMSAIFCECEFGGLASLQRLKIYNNTIACVDGYGINVNEHGTGAIRLTDLQILNNLIVDCGTHSTSGNISVSANGNISGLVMDYNLAAERRLPRSNWKYQDKDQSLAQMQSLGLEVHSKENPAGDIFIRYIYQDPNNDYHLSETSAGCDMGTTLSSDYLLDVTGRMRSAPWDVGCYERAYLRSSPTVKTWYVRPRGYVYGKTDGTGYSDAWGGFRSITWDSISAGDTLYVCGLFTETLNIPKSGYANMPITIRGDYASDLGILQCDEDSAISAQHQEYLIFDGLTINRAPGLGIDVTFSQYCQIRNCNISGIGTKSSSSIGINGLHSGGTSIYKCRITDDKGPIYGMGIFISSELPRVEAKSVVDGCLVRGTTDKEIVVGSDAEVLGCVIEGSTDPKNPDECGIFVQGSRTRISRNAIYRGKRGILVRALKKDSSVYVCDDVTIDNNLVVGTAASAIYGECLLENKKGAPDITMRNLKIYNNTVVAAGAGGIVVNQTQCNDKDEEQDEEQKAVLSFAGLKIKNNLVVDCGEESCTTNIVLSPSIDIPGFELDYQCVGEYDVPNRENYAIGPKRQLLKPYTQQQMQDKGLEHHSKENPPGTIFTKYDFHALAQNDFTLANNSPAIGMAENLEASFVTDITGATRGEKWDVGCYAYVAGE